MQTNNAYLVVNKEANNLLHEKTKSISANFALTENIIYELLQTFNNL